MPDIRYWTGIRVGQYLKTIQGMQIGLVLTRWQLVIGWKSIVRISLNKQHRTKLCASITGEYQLPICHQHLCQISNTSFHKQMYISTSEGVLVPAEWFLGNILQLWECYISGIVLLGWIESPHLPWANFENYASALSLLITNLMPQFCKLKAANKICEVNHPK